MLLTLLHCYACPKPNPVFATSCVVYVCVQWMKMTITAKNKTFSMMPCPLIHVVIKEDRVRLEFWNVSDSKRWGYFEFVLRALVINRQYKCSVEFMLFVHIRILISNTISYQIIFVFLNIGMTGASTRTTANHSGAPEFIPFWGSCCPILSLQCGVLWIILM